MIWWAKLLHVKGCLYCFMKNRFLRKAWKWDVHVADIPHIQEQLWAISEGLADAPTPGKLS